MPDVDLANLQGGRRRRRRGFRSRIRDRSTEQAEQNTR
jgi:hypothetical protein